MGGFSIFMIVSRNDAPMYETEIMLGSGSASRQSSPEAAHLHQFVMHASLDIVDELAATSPVPYLKVVNKFYELYVSAYVTAGGARFLMLHDQRNEDGIKSFFQDVHELYVKALLNPLQQEDGRISSPAFDIRVQAYAKRHL